MIAEAVIAAQDELSTLSRGEIDRATAIKWGVRAVAAMRMYRQSGSLRWFAQSVEFEHEAIEHAACLDESTFSLFKKELQMLLNAAVAGR